MNPYWEKSVRAAKSARLLLDDGDVGGAVDRAYYAMFEAARAALTAIDVRHDETKTHTGLRRLFSRHLVKPGQLPIGLGKALSVAEELRHAADYDTDPVDDEDARTMLLEMDAFLEAVGKFLAVGAR